MKTDKRNVFAIRSFLSEYLDLHKDKDDESLAVDSIRKGVVFKGANLWILIFATFMASLGLNVNSTAVIIGAMLISPLMGPIMGIGLAVGVSDFDLVKRSFKSFLITTAFSVVTSTIFFLISPLAEAQSELLARTSPNIYDVLIALFGGLAGVVALSTKEKGNVIPGVAIATALMPPLCTAGYGLATGNLAFFLGAFYLYFINSVFIAVATFIGVRVMKFRPKEFVDKTREMKVRKYIVLIVILTMVPAIYLTTGIIKETVFKNSASRFIAEELQFDNTQIIDKTIHLNDSNKEREIRVVLVGAEVPEAAINVARQKLPKYNLKDTRLVVIQGLGDSNTPDLSTIKASLMEDFYKESRMKIQSNEEQIKLLESTVQRYKEYSQMSSTIAPELTVLYPSVEKFSIFEATEVDTKTMKSDTVMLAVLRTDRDFTSEERIKLQDWLKTRVKAKKLKIILDK
ncbi:TIGR00341 family protein [Bacteroides propionicifaciens]|jgi:uncharacterized hydrophobic protein (TIGR00271 family)|uniref:TIGR00341 family protein n=1 Tax=Bacteroides propionicifaciens TaxID=392838 RepID=UPI0003744961|nr:TIGR00341 family protein [Bacteroides propionicifaciens]